MKNLSIKKVALGLLLAGYAASGAFAALVASTNKTIIGNAPILKSNRNGDDHTIKVDLERNGRPLGSTTQVAVGDTIKVTYALYDADGDTEGTVAKKTANSVDFWYKVTKTGAWKQIDTKSITKDVGVVSVTIPTEVAGATQIGITIRGETEFGNPSVAENWLFVSDIFSSKAPGRSPTKPTDPGSDDYGPGVVPTGGNPGMPIGGGDDEKLGIFLVDASGVIDRTKGLSYSDTDLAPTYGQTYEMMSWIDNKTGLVGKYENGEDLTTTGYAVSSEVHFEWYLAKGDSNEDAIPNRGNDVTVLTDDVILREAQAGVRGLQIVLGKTVTLPTGGWNDVYKTEFKGQTPKAGLQGFKLSARIINIKDGKRSQMNIPLKDIED